MAWSLVGISVSAIINSGSPTATQSVTLPTGLQKGDIVFVAIACDNSAASGVSGGQGYTWVLNTNNAAPGIHFAYKVMGASPDSTVNITRYAGSKRSCVIQAWRGVYAASAADTGPSTSVGVTSNTVDCAGITTTKPNSLAIYTAYLDDDDSTVSTWPTGYTNTYSGNTGQSSTTDGSTVAMASKIVTSAGSEDPTGLTWSSSDATDAFVIAFRSCDLQYTGTQGVEALSRSCGSTYSKATSSTAKSYTGLSGVGAFTLGVADTKSVFNDFRQDILDAIVGNLSTSTSWNAVRRGISVTAVARTDANTVTITLPALASYDIAATETLTVNINNRTVTSKHAIVGSPTISISVAGAGTPHPYTGTQGVEALSLGSTTVKARGKVPVTGVSSVYGFSGTKARGKEPILGGAEAYSSATVKARGKVPPLGGAVAYGSSTFSSNARTWVPTLGGAYAYDASTTKARAKAPTTYGAYSFSQASPLSKGKYPTIGVGFAYGTTTSYSKTAGAGTAKDYTGGVSVALSASTEKARGKEPIVAGYGAYTSGSTYSKTTVGTAHSYTGTAGVGAFSYGVADVKSVFDDYRQDILDAIVGNLSTATSWNNVRSGISVTAVVRTDSNTVTITLPALASYDIGTAETLTVNINNRTVTSKHAIVGSPTINIAVAGASQKTYTGLATGTLQQTAASIIDRVANWSYTGLGTLAYAASSVTESTAAAVYSYTGSVSYSLSCASESSSADWTDWSPVEEFNTAGLIGGTQVYAAASTYSGVRQRTYVGQGVLVLSDGSIRAIGRVYYQGGAYVYAGGSIYTKTAGIPTTYTYTGMGAYSFQSAFVRTRGKTYAVGGALKQDAGTGIIRVVGVPTAHPYTGSGQFVLSARVERVRGKVYPGLPTGTLVFTDVAVLDFTPRIAPDAEPKPGVRAGNKEGVPGRGGNTEGKPTALVGTLESVPSRPAGSDGAWTVPEYDGGVVEPPVDGSYTEIGYFKEWKPWWQTYSKERKPT